MADMAGWLALPQGLQLMVKPEQRNLLCARYGVSRYDCRLVGETP